MSKTPPQDDEQLNQPIPGRNIVYRDGELAIRLPGGHLLRLAEWLTGHLYSAMVVDPRAQASAFRLFEYARSEPLPGSVDPELPDNYTPGDLAFTKYGAVATTAHTNMQRTSAAGLPQDWEMFVTHWRASVSCPLSEDVAAWASETSVEYVYNHKLFASATLLDLLHGTLPMGDPFPIWMRQQCAWYVDVRSTPEAMERVRRSCAGLDDRLAEVLRDLQSIIIACPEHASSKLAAAAYDRIKALRPFTVWVHLEGALKRAVM